MVRNEVYQVIDKEREHQKKAIVLRGWAPDNKKTVGDFLTYMSIYLEEAKKKYTTEAGQQGALDNLRKLLALGVACAEVHGLPERETK